MAVSITQGGLNFNSNLDPAGFLKGANVIQQSNAKLMAALDSFNRKIINNNKDQERSFTTLEKAIAGFFAVSQINSFVREVINVRGEFQKTASAFETMLGSKEKADKLMSAAVKLAANTPFDLAGVTTGAKQLLAYGFAAEDVTANLTMLGNIASGVGSTLTDVVYLYGTLKASGRVTQMDINQFANRGIPIYEELAKSMGVATDKVRDMVSAGQVGFPQIEKAFNNMTSSGGRFFELMEKQSKSLSGRVANLEDAWSQMMNKIGEQSEGILAGSIAAATALIENYDEVLKALGVLIAMYGAHKAALILSTIATSGLTAAETLHYGVLVVVQRAQALLNATIMANPYVAAATAIAGLVAAVILFNDSTSKAEKLQAELNARNDEFTQKVDGLKTKYSELSQIVRDLNQTEYQRQKSYEELQKLFPQTLKNLSQEAFLRLAVADAQSKINQELDDFNLSNLKIEFENTSKEIKTLSERIEFINQKIKESAGDRQSKAMWKGQLNDAKETLTVLQDQNSSIQKQIRDVEFSKLSKKQQLDYLKDQLEVLNQQKNKINQFPTNPFSQWNLNGITKQIDDIQGKIKLLTDKDGNIIRNEAFFESEISRLKKDRAPLDINSKEFAKYTREIQKLEEELSKATSKKSTNPRSVEKLDDQRLNFLQRIKEAQQEVESARLGQNAKEISDNKIKYERMLNDIKEFNEKAKKLGQKGISQKDIDAVGNLAKEEENNIKYRQQTTQIALEYEQQRQLFVDFENFKTTYGEAEARKRYGNEVKNNSELLDSVLKDLEKLEAVRGKKTLSVTEQERYDNLKKLERDLTNEELKRFATALEAAKSYNDKIKDLDNEYLQQRADLMAATDGKATQSQLDNLLKVHQIKKNALIEEKAFAESGYAELMAIILTLTKKSAIDRLNVIKSGYLNNKELSPEQKDNFVKGIDQQISNINEDTSIKKTSDAWKKYRELVKEGKKGTLEAREAYKLFADGVTNSAADVNQVLGSVAGALGELGIGGEGLQDTIKNVMGVVDGIGGIAKGIASGNPVDIITGSIKLLTSAINLFNTKDKKIQKQIDSYQANLEALQKGFEDLDKAVSNSIGESYYSDTAKQIENLKRQQKELEKIRFAESQKKKSDSDKLKELDQQIADIPNKIADIESAISQQLIQGTFKDLANSLADALLTAFQTGEDAIAAMDRSFNQFIGNAIKNSLKLKLIEPIVAQLTEDLVKYAKGNDNSIVGFNFEAYKKELNDAGKLFTDALNANKEFFTESTQGTKQGALSKGIQGITETTANRLEAEFGGLRLAFMQYDQNFSLKHSEIMAMNNRKLEVLLSIKDNTGVTAENTAEQIKKLEALEKHLGNIDNKMKDADSLMRGAGL